MFRSSVANTNVDDQEMHNALPNYYGHIRTLKEDYAKFKEGKLEEEDSLVKKPEGAKGAEPSISFADGEERDQILSPFRPSAPPTSSLPKEQPNPTATSLGETGFPPEKDSKDRNSYFKKDRFSPDYGNNEKEASFENSPFSEKNLVEEETSEEKLEKEISKQNGTGKRTFAIAIIFLTLLIGGAGFYYWWFFVKTQKAAVPTETIPVQEKTEVSTEDKSLRYLNFDPASSKSDLKQVLQKFSSDFLSSAAENDLIEVKILDGENKSLSAASFTDSFGLAIPSSLRDKFSDDYSLFFKNEKSKMRSGMVFKLNKSENVKEDLKKWEASITNDLAPLYLSQAPTADTIAFSSNQYKNADIRYFNFPSQEPGSLSLDYVFVTDKVSNYFIVSTSKSSIRSILDYLLK